VAIVNGKEENDPSGLLLEIFKRIEAESSTGNSLILISILNAFVKDGKLGRHMPLKAVLVFALDSLKR
jgi:hypothetical protein